ncbi:hypothetical protein CBR_g49924 [Chara braunii]|uniref:Uncharacterized protein n=1 Tax=Chara braunii TaxID=69332 RepID=A0A388JPB7_CHABU|nr:hypothetical protein CBR_g49924 [Chara braunii]|eukprot:GBG59660.1 hypothetical protein CBR_g49924 [Chara braunii]
MFSCGAVRSNSQGNNGGGDEEERPFPPEMMPRRRAAPPPPPPPPPLLNPHHHHHNHTGVVVVDGDVVAMDGQIDFAITDDAFDISTLEESRAMRQARQEAFQRLRETAMVGLAELIVPQDPNEPLPDDEIPFDVVWEESLDAARRDWRDASWPDAAREDVWEHGREEVRDGASGDNWNHGWNESTHAGMALRRAALGAARRGVALTIVAGSEVEADVARGPSLAAPELGEEGRNTRDREATRVLHTEEVVETPPRQQESAPGGGGVELRGEHEVGGQVRMIAKAEVEWRHASGRTDNIVVGDLGGGEQLIPIVLMWMTILSQDSLESIVHLLSLSIGLWVECNAILERGSVGFKEVFPELRKEARVTVTDDVLGETVVTWDMVEEENGEVLGVVRCGARGEVGTFSQATNNDIDAIMSAVGLGETANEVHGNGLPPLSAPETTTLCLEVGSLLRREFRETDWVGVYGRTAGAFSLFHLHKVDGREFVRGERSGVEWVAEGVRVGGGELVRGGRERGFVGDVMKNRGRGGADVSPSLYGVRNLSRWMARLKRLKRDIGGSWIREAARSLRRPRLRWEMNAASLT